jgi:hypothetical protein
LARASTPAVKHCLGFNQEDAACLVRRTDFQCAPIAETIRSPNPDLPAYAAGIHELQRSTRNVFFAGGGDEVTEVTQFHVRPSIPLSYAEARNMVFRGPAIRVALCCHDESSKSK